MTNESQKSCIKIDPQANKKSQIRIEPPSLLCLKRYIIYARQPKPVCKTAQQITKEIGTAQLQFCLTDLQDLQKIFHVIVGQLRLLFGFKSDYIRDDDMDVVNILASEKGFTEWELDVLYRHHACYNLISCTTTLESLSKLVQSLPRMIIMDDIGKQVKYSLEAASLAQNNASLGIYDASAASSLQARSLAEDAFFHPSIMSISYSSLEHYFAIYMPFFAPVSLHLILAVVREIGRYRRERAKYLAFIAEHAKTS